MAGKSLFSHYGRSAALFCALLLSLLWSVELAADSQERSVVMRSYSLGALKLYASEPLDQLAGVILADLRPGIERLGTLLSSPPLQREKSIWLVANRSEQRAVLEEGIPALDGAESATIEALLGRSIYRDRDHLLIRLTPRSPPAPLLRLMFSFYADELLLSIAPEAATFRIGWFYSGYAAWLAWLVEGEQRGVSREAILEHYERYYLPHIDPELLWALRSIERPDDWQRALAEEGGSIYAQAALYMASFVRQYGGDRAAEVIRAFDNTYAFQIAFERVTAESLEQFEDRTRMHWSARASK